MGKITALEQVITVRHGHVEDGPNPGLNDVGFREAELVGHYVRRAAGARCVAVYYPDVLRCEQFAERATQAMGGAFTLICVPFLNEARGILQPQDMSNRLLADQPAVALVVTQASIPPNLTAQLCRKADIPFIEVSFEASAHGCGWHVDLQNDRIRVVRQRDL